mmetsp:Transcript_32491/g.92084  ORF Transcript_32491/g.92084 Transcript_32491/m.92084 type:complete len:322 (-) Transcript_32491:182-1147(-)|eukprot:CAMPEP_0117665142 /NCGR_PEP_ID=MMETSP0804-20121206/9641_1 /TAXON_ID=1074897 /ORGANISM="Tetraselmis astigmatica, Strain CCMP880" /LENGTH=321 /DNA_ID=CAMNT_0005472513 /DNA_START=272 /DNA_END=1237 /DNA_ORIENTATION=-
MPPPGKYGCFSEPSYIGVGDPYTKPKSNTGRDQGLNFKASTRKSGKLNDGCFDKFKPLYEKETYEEGTKNRVAAITARNSKRMTDMPFKPGTPMKSSSGLGDFYGTFGGKTKYIEQGSFLHQKKKGDFVSMPPNIVTNPIKKGSYGYCKTTLSEKHPGRKTKGVCGEYEYIPDPFEGGGAMNRLSKLQATRSMLVSDLPFKPSSPAKRGTYGYIKTNIGNKAGGSMGEFKYREQGPSAHVRPSTVDTPFRPSHPPKSGFNATLSRFPLYAADPMEPKIAETKRIREEALSKMQSTAWAPEPKGCKSGPVDSIMKKNTSLFG